MNKLTEDEIIRILLDWQDYLATHNPEAFHHMRRGDWTILREKVLDKTREPVSR